MTVDCIKGSRVGRRHGVKAWLSQGDLVDTLRIRKAVRDKRALVEGGVLCWTHDPVEMGHFVSTYIIDHHVDQN